ncbi:MAG: ATP-binding protein [Lachnospiraceae bacterium]|nr:ATP-binding protein [Lachnospiraceae bacterium]
MNITGRREERRELERCERSGKSELVCVYGRRRVGKTFLVEQTFSESIAFRATGVEEGNTRQQLKSFHLRLLEYGDTVRTIPKNWFEAFARLERILSGDSIVRSAHGKRIVFFDEFPWFDTVRSDFLMAFGEFWNRCGSGSGDIMFIICGSATSWIIGNILENTGSLYHRVTCQIFLAPFTLQETEWFFREREAGWSRKQIAECRMVFGGLPFFLELLHTDDSLRQNIDRLIFQPQALLQSESKRLLESTLRKSPVYGQILQLLSEHRCGLKQKVCYEKLNIPRGSFVRAADDLLKCGYIRKYVNMHETRKPTYLQIVDPFLLFHFRFLSASGKKEISSFSEFMQEEGRYTNWRGMAFELLCLEHVRQIKSALGIAGVRTNSFPWISRKKKGGAQIDLVIERDDGITNLCEMKYTDKPFTVTAAVEEELLHKKEVFREETKTKQTLKTVLVSASGVAGVAHTEHISQILTLEELFAS